ncbi:hypothetical protein ACHAWF_005242 [Thalassiosira exigua]
MLKTVAVATCFLFAQNFLSGSVNLHLCNAQLSPDDPANMDYYCGWDWIEANANCEFRCPSGIDDDCPPMPNGRKRRCIAAAGCFARFKKVYWTGVVSLAFDKELHWTNEAVNVAVGTETKATDAALNEEAESSPTSVGIMSEEATKAFENTFQDYLFVRVNENLQVSELAISSVTVKEQEYDKPCVEAVYGGYAPSVTSLDLIVRVVGEFIPIGDLKTTDDQFGDKVLFIISTDPSPFVDAVKYSSPFFEAITGLSAIEEDDMVEAPSSSPSEAPSRDFDQVFDIRIDPRPTGSYGIVFSVRTPRGGNTIMMTAMSFVTLHEGKLEYEVWTRLGPYENYVGKNNFWELIASGQTTGRGGKEYTPILGEDTTVEDGDETLNYMGFKPVHVPGDRGMRSFYVAVTKRFTKEDGSPIPILFSYPIKGENDGLRVYEVIDDTPEIEIYEGDGVLDYPWSNWKDGPYYRRPRGFIGFFEYDRYPCHPVINFTGWPCPYQPKTRKPTALPTTRPTAPPVTKVPTTYPTNAPTKNPAAQTNQTEADAQVGTIAQIETDTESGAEMLNPSSSGVETLTIGVPKDEASNGMILSWKITYRSWDFALAILLMLAF